MTGLLVYVMGPSGAGKDSLLAWLEAQPAPTVPIQVARRTVTRAARAGDEAHQSVDVETFARWRDADAFAFHWQANGLHYGVHHDELRPVQAGRCVLVNGSRAYLPQALAKFPHMAVVHVAAGVDTLRRRLLARGRETPVDVDARVRRALAYQPPQDAIRIDNDGALADAGTRLLHALAQRMTAAEPRR